MELLAIGRNHGLSGELPVMAQKPVYLLCSVVAVDFGVGHCLLLVVGWEAIVGLFGDEGGWGGRVLCKEVCRIELPFYILCVSHTSSVTPADLIPNVIAAWHSE